MNLKTLERLVRAGTITVEEVLAHAGFDRLDQMVTMLRRHRAAKEVCAALVQRIASTVHAPAVPLWVDGDPVRLGQIVANLLATAVKYSGEEGCIELRLACEDRSGAPGAEAVLRIVDNGIGIAPEMLPRIVDLFSPGEQGPARSEGGLGVGLALVRELVALHGGRVEVTSLGPDEGAEFVVRFPAIEPPAPAAETGRERTTGAERRRVLCGRWPPHGKRSTRSPNIRPTCSSATSRCRTRTATR